MTQPTRTIAPVVKWSALIGIMLIGAFLRFHQLEYKSFWVDEMIQVLIAQQGFWGTFEAMRTQFAAPPLDYLITGVVLQTVGNRNLTNEFVLRFPAAVWGTLTIPFGYVLAKRITRSTLTALVAAYLIALAPLLVRFSQEVRFYSLSVMLMPAFVYFFIRAWQNSNRKNWSVAGVMLVLAFFTHYYVALVLGALLVYVALDVGVRMWRARSLRFTPEVRGRLLIGGGAFMLVLVVVVPWLLYALPRVATQNWFSLASIPELIGEPLTSGHIGGTLHLYAVRALGLAIFPALGVVGLYAALHAGKPWASAMALIVVLGGGGVVLLDWVFGYFFTSRQLLFVVPFDMVLIAMGLVALARFFMRKTRLGGGVVLVGALACVTIVFGLSLRAYYDWPKEDWRSAAELVEQAAQTHSTAILGDSITFPNYLAFYQPALGEDIRPAGVVDAVVERSERVWFVTVEGKKMLELQTLRQRGWTMIELNLSPELVLFFGGRVPEDELWGEIATLNVPPAVLVYSPFLEKSGVCENQNAPAVVRARAALAAPGKPPLLDAQKVMLQSALLRYC